MKDKGYTNFWGANKVNYGRFASGRELQLVEMKGGWQEFALETRVLTKTNALLSFRPLN